MRKTIFVLALALVSTCAFAVDGVVLINQAALNAAGGTYKITLPGSYRLSGNLIAPVDQMAIQITANDVVLDLNGFNVRCSSEPVRSPQILSCIGDAGILGPGNHNIAIRNGTVTASESGASGAFIEIFGLFLSFSDRITMENLHIEVNADVAGADYNLGANSIIRHNILSGNQTGPNTACPSLVEGNINLTGGSGRSGVGCVFVNNIGSF